MEHLLLKAATTAATDKGEFTAVISTARPIPGSYRSSVKSMSVEPQALQHEA